MRINSELPRHCALSLAAPLLAVLLLHRLQVSEFEPVSASAAFAADIFQVVRLVSLVLAYYVLVAGILSFLAVLTQSRSLAKWVSRCTFGFARIWLGTTLGIVLVNETGAIAEVAVAQSIPSETVQVPVLEPLPAENSEIKEAQPLEPPKLERSSTDASGEGKPERPSAETGREWKVRPGDHLWGIAEATIESAGKQGPTEREIASYWQQIIELNRANLVDPNNPDLIVVGQVVQLPRQ